MTVAAGFWTAGSDPGGELGHFRADILMDGKGFRCISFASARQLTGKNVKGSHCVHIVHIRT